MEIIQPLIDSPTALLNVASALGILIHCVFIINKMNEQTPFICSLAYALLAVGAFAIVIGILYGKLSNEPHEACINLAILIICLCNAYIPQKRGASDK